MSAIQNFFMLVLPANWAASMEADSRAWTIQCPSCQHERSVWETGGIRWKAVGNPKWYMVCPSCHHRGWHKVYYKETW